MAEILRDAGLSSLIDPDTTIERLADGFTFTEGPLWVPEADSSGSLIFQDMKGNRTHSVALDGGSPAMLVRDGTSGANGQTFGPDGLIYFCEQFGRRISRMNPDGSGLEMVVENWFGKRLNSPNDIVCRSDGRLYFTDPPYGVDPRERSLHFQGVFSLDVAGHVGSPLLDLLVDDFEKPNGLAFSPDERTLYICDTARYHIRAFDLNPSGTLAVGSGRVVARLDPTEPGGPDGLKVDRAGRLYVAVAQGLWVFEPGEPFRLLGILSMPKRPSNLAWCGRSADILGITMVDSVVRVAWKTEGILPPFTPRGG